MKTAMILMSLFSISTYSSTENAPEFSTTEMAVMMEINRAVDIVSGSQVTLSEDYACLGLSKGEFAIDIAKLSELNKREYSSSKVYRNNNEVHKFYQHDLIEVSDQVAAAINERCL